MKLYHVFFEEGLNPIQVAAISGHKTLQMLKRYTHLKAEDLAEMLADIEKKREVKKAQDGDTSSSLSELKRLPENGL